MYGCVSFQLINESFKTAEELKTLLGENYRDDQSLAARRFELHSLGNTQCMTDLPSD